MASFALEDHVLRISEHQSLLFDYLGERSPKWSWGADLAEGRLNFTDDRTGKTVFACRTFLLGSKSDSDNSFLWGWANPSTTQLPDDDARWSVLKTEAERAGAAEFLREDAFPLHDEKESIALAIRAAGALGCFTFYAGGYPGGSAFLAVDTAPEIVARPVDVLRKVTVISTSISLLPFNHRAASLAYLGPPTRTTGEALTWDVMGAELAVTFDAQGRIADMKTSAGPENVAPRPPNAPKSGLFKRLLGG